MDHRTLLELLGTDDELAARFGLHPVSIWRWRTGGIPPEHWVAVADLAKERRLRVTVDSLARAAKDKDEVS
jgi:hypothetical protein